MIVSRVFVAALLSGVATALPHRVRDSAIDEPAVSSPNGTPITDSVSQPMSTPADNGSSGSWSSSSSSSADSSWSSPSVDSSSTSLVAQTTSTTVASSSYQTPTYGSGSSNWGSWGGSGSSYNDCVSQCVAQYGSAPQPWTPPPTQTSSGGGGGGNGVTHTVIVAPSQGVFRYVPFALNASVGDTVQFMWGADNHTVTKGSVLTPCNATSDSPFASGIQVKDFVFTQVVNDTNPTFFHCAVPGHCQKGMFGIINPPSNSGAATSVSLMMSSWTSSNPNLAAYSAITTNMTQNNTVAARWGGNIDVATLPEWSQSLVAENVMYTRNFLAANSEVIGQDGSINLSSSANTPLMFPQDVSAEINGAAAAPSASGSAAAISAAASSTTLVASASSTSAAASGAPGVANGAVTTSPKFVVALVAAAASFFLL